ncbi:MAG TPA: DNA polymerase III subunit gamma/tau [Thermoanaerobaculia bacterium]|jgi:DNA polymerase-3 subunit gamma/tau
MTYQVLARKWRPQDFASLVGQEPIVTALRNALLEGRIAQAYVFSGIRGVGKTTAARVFAKALNCERLPGSRGRAGVDPCNECPSCREITEGKDLINVREIDAATYSKVEQVRELTESLQHGGTRPDRYKVVIMDEIHRLSRQAFDALLKIVEEPPARLVFIFATTELDAVPATILSRCQEFQFRRVPSPLLAAHLRSIADAESIAVSDAALRMIARAGDGSVRDAVALLDQMATYGGGEIAEHDASRLLGGLDAEIFRLLLSGILGGDHAAILAAVREVESSGWDPHHVYSHFLAYVRDALHLALGDEPDLALEEATALGRAIESVSYERLMQIAQLLLSGEQIVRRSEFGLLALEITWLRAAELPKVTRVEDLLSGRSGVPGARDLGPAASAPAAPAPPAPVPAPTSASTPSASAPADALGRFRKLLSRRPPLAARFAEDLVRLDFQEGVLRVRAAGDALSLQKALARQGNAEALSQALAEVWGEGARYELVNGDQPAAKSAAETPGTTPRAGRGAPPAAAPQHDPLWARVESDPLVRTVRESFPGPITSIQPKDRRRQG